MCRTARANLYGHPHQSFAEGGNPTVSDCSGSGQRRRIRDSSSSLHLETFSRGQVLNRTRRGLGHLSPPVSRNISHPSYHSLAPRMPNDNPFHSALQVIDDFRIRAGMSASPRYEQSNFFIPSPHNHPPLTRSFASHAARLSTTSPSTSLQSKQMTDWDTWSNDVHQRHTGRHQG